MPIAAKRGRPPNLSIAPPKPATIELDSHDDLDSPDDAPLSLDYDSSPDQSPIPLLTVDDDSEISKDLAALEQLRRNVQQNLRLRPIRSKSDLRTKVDLPKVRLGDSSPWDTSTDMTSPASSISSYFTPLSDAPLSARYIGSSPSSSATRSPTPPRQPEPVDPGVLYDRLCGARRPLLIDTRPPAAHFAFHIRHSINIAIPSLIMKRSRKPGSAAFQSLESLRQFVTTEQGKRDWDLLMRPGGPWDGDVVVYDDEMDPNDTNTTAWALLPVLAPLLSYGAVAYLAGGISSAGHHPDLETLILSGGDVDYADGLFQLDTNAASRSKALPQIEQQPSRSPLPLMSSVMSSGHVNLVDATPSPPPSQVGFRRPPPPPRRPSAPNLRKLDTKSAERLKLQVRTVPLRSASLSLAPPSPGLDAPHSPAPTSSWSLSSPTSSTSEIPTAYFTPPHTPKAFGFARPPSPATARPDDPPTTEEPYPEFAISTILPGFLFLGPELTTPAHVAELRALGVRRILNIAAECDDDHGLRLREVFERYVKIPMRDTVEEENIARGVREVCDILDDARLHSAATYVHCKAGKSRSVTAVMAYLIHANHWTLSRAYAFVLERRKGISPNIGFVSELMTFEEEELGGKSIGVQPGADGGDGGGGGAHQQGHYGVAAGGRRGGHVRESLPPAFVASHSSGPEDFGAALFGGGTLSAGLDGPGRVAMGDAGQEMEVRDAAGRYRHARRAPVDENTLQPLRRVSKAGLESSAYS
ncbi:hypothetical protein B0H10DRAFT_2167589 [Mycena sp. CBHHK59/15]|nr:hypothetical protein B0H10DRAFT_2167589 [Mycena sp. CBHHK59/15]